jgi:hypothetical protein
MLESSWINRASPTYGPLSERWHRPCTCAATPETHPPILPMHSLSPSRLPHHFLFLLPETTTPAEVEIVEAAARKLTPLGYVYIASPHEPTMADRGGVRFMPLRMHRLPCFGSLTGVMIVRDRHLMLAAQETYPEAQIIVFDPARAPHEEALRDLPMALLATAALRPPQMQKAAARPLPQAA